MINWKRESKIIISLVKEFRYSSYAHCTESRHYKNECGTFVDLNRQPPHSQKNGVLTWQSWGGNPTIPVYKIKVNLFERTYTEIAPWCKNGQTWSYDSVADFVLKLGNLPNQPWNIRLAECNGVWFENLSATGLTLAKEQTEEIACKQTWRASIFEKEITSASGKRYVLRRELHTSGQRIGKPTNSLFAVPIVTEPQTMAVINA